jgi:hypothetical protein
LSKAQPRNDLNAAVPKFCLELEVDRRIPQGRVRTAQEFLTHFFPHDRKSRSDRIFKTMPREVRGPILTGWGIRGRRTALLDDDERVQSVVHDALVAQDVTCEMFEEGLAANVIMRWIDLTDWWRFWRGGKIAKYTLLRALESGYENALFDAEWFLTTIRSHGGKLQGTDVLAEGLSKDELTEWVRNIHALADGTSKGIVSALGWETIVARTADDVLLAVLDAMALKVSLVVPVEDKAGATPAGTSGATPELVSGAAQVAATASGEQTIASEDQARLFNDDDLIPVAEWAGEDGNEPVGSDRRTPVPDASDAVDHGGEDAKPKGVSKRPSRPAPGKVLTTEPQRR